MLLRDADGDGAAEVRTAFLEGLNSPFGMVLVGEDFYVANTDAVVRFPYRDGETRIADRGQRLAELPAGERNHHWTKNVIASRDDARLYVTVGSNSNVAEHGMEEEESRAAILEIDRATGATRLFATGLRNPNGLAWEPATGALWTVVNERDEIGSDLVPDYLTSVRDGGFYGWPYSYFGAHVDERDRPQRPELVTRALAPEYALGSHTGSLGLVFYEASLLPARYHGGAVIGRQAAPSRHHGRSGIRLRHDRRGCRTRGQRRLAHHRAIGLRINRLRVLFAPYASGEHGSGPRIRAARAWGRAGPSWLRDSASATP
jgi:glucose/arabinose dehydrogenase